ncbi:MAG: ATP-dependent 6-phosphofructokinase [Acidobacteriia bacterium]|nr:ATP-dependent 6-phosphofructokinase [Terriglobia bacterium]
MKRIGVVTGGGDAAGLNAAIKWVVYGAISRFVKERFGNELDVYGLKEGWESLMYLDSHKGLEDDRYVVPLTAPIVRKIDRDGGTFIGTSRTNPFSMKDEKGEKVDRSDIAVRNFQALGLDALIAMGGEDTLGVAHRLWQKGVPCVGIPKTIDLDLPGTDYSLGFDSAVNNIKLLIDHARSVAGSHRKVAVIEVMGRHAGFLAISGGIVSSAHFILIPEYEFDLDLLCDLINRRKNLKSRYTLVVVAEGAKECGGQIVAHRQEIDNFGHVHLGGIGEHLADEIKRRSGLDTFSEKLGYLQRGGAPSAFDVKMGFMFGVTAVNLVVNQKFGQMVAVENGHITEKALTALNGPVRSVDVDLMYDKERLNARRDTALGWRVL